MEAGEKGSAVPRAFGPAHSMLAGIAGWTQPCPQEMSSGLCRAPLAAQIALKCPHLTFL